MSPSQTEIDATPETDASQTTAIEAGTSTDPIAETKPSTSVGEGGPGPIQGDLHRILGLSVPVSAVLAERDMSIESILDIRPGTIVEFDVAFDAELMLCAADRPIGAGQAVKAGEKFGLRVNHIGSVKERIDALGGQ